MLTTMIAFVGVQLFYKLTLSQVHVFSMETETIQNKKKPSHNPEAIKPITAYEQLSNVTYSYPICWG